MLAFSYVQLNLHVLDIVLDIGKSVQNLSKIVQNLPLIVQLPNTARYKAIISEEHEETVNSALAKCIENAMVLNIDDYHSIHTKRMPNTTTTSIAVHLATILMNPIMTQPAILKMNTHNSVLQ